MFAFFFFFLWTKSLSKWINILKGIVLNCLHFQSLRLNVKFYRKSNNKVYKLSNVAHPRCLALRISNFMETCITIRHSDFAIASSKACKSLSRSSRGFAMNERYVFPNLEKYSVNTRSIQISSFRTANSGY